MTVLHFTTTMTSSLTNPEVHLTVTKMVPTLLTAADWAKWNDALHVFLDAYDPRIWEILQSTEVYPQPDPEDTETIGLLATQNKKLPRDVTEKEFDMFKTAAEDQYKVWKKLETHALRLLWSTLHLKPREQITGVTNIKVAYEKLRDDGTIPSGQTTADCGLNGPRVGSRRAFTLSSLSRAGKRA